MASLVKLSDTSDFPGFILAAASFTTKPVIFLASSTPSFRFPDAPFHLFFLAIRHSYLSTSISFQSLGHWKQKWSSGLQKPLGFAHFTRRLVLPSDKEDCTSELEQATNKTLWITEDEDLLQGCPEISKDLILEENVTRLVARVSLDLYNGVIGSQNMKICHNGAMSPRWWTTMRYIPKCKDILEEVNLCLVSR